MKIRAGPVLTEKVIYRGKYKGGNNHKYEEGGGGFCIGFYGE